MTDARDPDAKERDLNDAQEAPGQFAGSSWALLEALLEGFCGATVEECYEELRLWFFRYALQRTRDRDVADDYADEAFIQVVRKVPRCDPARFGNSGFVGWARTVGLRQIEELERTRRRRERLLPLGDGRDAGPDDDPPLLRLPSHAPSPLEDAESGEIRDRIAAALSGLTERERSVFVLKEIEGFSHDEIA
ncbi:MAG TPA: sigma-70 family RNA polymerase sigma factor, partial [Longimicrobium sp.]|nr:sigma-70 family RNA polymerase sigma factor [Longimicrobium sp.]